MTWFLFITGCHRPGRRRRRGQGRPGRGGAAASPGGRRRRRPGERRGRAGAEDGDEGAASNGKVAPAGPPLLRQALGYHHERSIDLKPKSYRGTERLDISLTLACAALPAAYRPHLPPPDRPPDFLREPSCSSPLAPTTAAPRLRPPPVPFYQHPCGTTRRSIDRRRTAGPPSALYGRRLRRLRFWYRWRTPYASKFQRISINQTPTAAAITTRTSRPKRTLTPGDTTADPPTLTDTPTAVKVTAAEARPRRVATTPATRTAAAACTSLISMRDRPTALYRASRCMPPSRCALDQPFRSRFKHLRVARMPLLSAPNE